MDAEDAEPPVKKPRKTKAYVPALRSGPYAILLALSTLSENSSTSLTKAQTIEIAQKHCDASFTAPTDPTKFYTAWSSMKTLQTKEYVYEFGRPTKKYALTDQGWEAAKKIRNASGLNNTLIVGFEASADSLSKGSTVPGQGAITSTSTQTTVPSNLVREPSIPGPSQLGHRSQSPGDTVDLAGDWYDDFVNYTAQGTVQQPLSQQQRRDTNTVPSNTPAEQHIQPSTIINPRAKSNADFIEILSSPPPTPPPKRKTQNEALKDTSTQRREPGMPGWNSFEHPRALTDVSANRVMCRDTTHTKSSNTSTELPTFQYINLPPGSFTVELVLDNREVRSKTDRDYIQSSLLDLGIQPTTRALEIGDCLWVARVHDPAILSRHGEEDSEIILDWILERKRLDDLIGSIKDGRFIEQKFRLRRSGVKNVVYVIEDITLAADVAQKYNEQMTSAIASTQVVDGFSVKRTRKLDDTIRYLARLTTLLKSIYEPQSLRVIPSHVLDRSTYLPPKASLKEPHYITYASFASLASKTDALTLRDIFLKMLMCARGITGEKAVEIQKRWETPRAFVEALEGCDDCVGRGAMDKDAKAMAATKKKRELVWNAAGHLVGRRKIGKAVSAKVGEVWGER